MKTHFTKDFSALSSELMGKSQFLFFATNFFFLHFLGNQTSIYRRTNTYRKAKGQTNQLTQKGDILKVRIADSESFELQRFGGCRRTPKWIKSDLIYAFEKKKMKKEKTLFVSENASKYKRLPLTRQPSLGFPVLCHLCLIV